MKAIEKARLIAGAVVLAATLYALMAAPGLVSDQDSTVPLRDARTARTGEAHAGHGVLRLLVARP